MSCFFGLIFAYTSCSMQPDEPELVYNPFEPVHVHIRIEVRDIPKHPYLFYGKMTNFNEVDESGRFTTKEYDGKLTPYEIKAYVTEPQEIVVEGYLYSDGAPFIFGGADIFVYGKDKTTLIKHLHHDFNFYFGTNNGLVMQQEKNSFRLSVDL